MTPFSTVVAKNREIKYFWVHRDEIFWGNNPSIILTTPDVVVV